ncbi:MAG: beta-aspartyl-peptidase (threonine type) [Cellvibrionaceae bacterium]|jgi:beta-aspartyl-peptidase (threonine type)
MTKYGIIIHGGAWDWPDEQDAQKVPDLIAAAKIGRDILAAGGSALDAVEKAVNYLEDAPTFEAGTGVPPNRNGVVQLDALIVDGKMHDFGSVAAVERVKNPISLARKVMEETNHCMFVGAGADDLARELGIPLIPNLELVDEESWRAFVERDASVLTPEWESSQPLSHDTVGAVAIDQDGNVASATSSSGSPFKPAGRVGDAPLLGSGGFALNGVGAVGCTGNGENIMRLLLAKYAHDKMAEGMTAQQAADASVAYMSSVYPNPMTGMIVVDAAGNLAFATSTPKIAVAWTDGDEIKTAMRPL